jgi:plastocyanin
MMRMLLPLAPLLLCAVAAAQHEGHQGMQVDSNGMAMNENRDRLPRGCDAISGDVDITVYAGRDYAEDRAGIIFGMSEHEVRVAPCSRLTVHFVNKDAVRHQWMVHGLPKYLYPAGMFHLEAMGGRRFSGTFIVPAEDRTYLVHCDMAQHMEKGMRAQLVVGKGSGDIWGVTGISDAFVRYPYLPAATIWLALLAICGGIAAALLWQARQARMSRR